MNYGPVTSKYKKIIHGSDYNPDQWIDYEGIIDEDFRLMELAHMNSMSIGIFSWMTIESEEGVYDFTLMDEIMDRMAEKGMIAVLATPSGGKPSWLSQKYPEILRVSEARVKMLQGVRHNHCFTSPIYREKVKAINTQIAMRYKDHPALGVWHISNEYGGECHCELCQEAFRDWLKEQYNNDLNALNHAWWNSFWSHTYTEWSQIESPSSIGESSSHALSLDWKRFVTHQTKDFMMNEIEPLRRLTPDIPITTNFMEIFHQLDYWKLAEPLDIISWDSYPRWHAGEDNMASGIIPAFMHDMCRSFKSGKPFMLMESTPSMTNWQAVTKLKKPGMHRLASIQAIAHGADTVQYFQWRKSRGAAEKFHGAVVDHVGHEHTRVFKEVASLGAELEKMTEIVGTSVSAEVAIIFDWDNKWALESCLGLNNEAKKYNETILAHYRAFLEQGVSVDVIDMEQAFDKYKMIVAPMLYMVKEGVGEKVEKFVKKGGVFITTYVSGLVNENDLCFLGGFPGPLKEVLGIWAEETDALYDYERNHVESSLNALKNDYEVIEVCDLIHAKSAQVLGHYKSDFYKGMPALTKNAYGDGFAYYIAFRNNKDFEKDFYKHLVNEHKIKKILDTELPSGVEVQTRYDDNSQFLFIMNFNDYSVEIDLGDHIFENLMSNEQIDANIGLGPYDAWVLKFIE